MKNLKKSVRSYIPPAAKIKILVIVDIVAAAVVNHSCRTGGDLVNLTRAFKNFRKPVMVKEEVLRNELECPVCMEEPRLHLLPCAHRCCMSCVGKQ